VSQVKDMVSMFQGAKSFNQTLCGDTWVSSEAQQDNLFKDSPGWICAASTIPYRTYITTDAAPPPAQSPTTTVTSDPLEQQSLYAIVGAAIVIFVIVVVLVVAAAIRTKEQDPLPETVVGSV